MRDLAVVGAGPAGLMVAVSAAARGLSVISLDPDPDAPWPNNYGIWVDALAAVGLEGCLAARWPAARVRLDDAREHLLPRAYGQVDNAALRQAMLRRAGAGLERRRARVTGAEHGPRSTRLWLAGGGDVEAKVVVDASGPTSALIEHGAAGPSAAQVAYGQELRVDGSPLPLHELLLMDYRPLPRARASERDQPASFLYAMPLAADRLFVEETVLVGRPAPSVASMQQRLQRRLDGLGLLRYDVLAEERCVIPMGGPVPRGPQRVVPFGAAARMVHPATGYQLDRALALAPALAEVIAAGLAAEAPPDAVAAAGWEVVWPTERRRLWAVYGFGMEVLLGLDGAGLRTFFDAFFGLRPEVWARYLSGVASGRDVAEAMAHVFMGATGPIKRRLMLQSLGPAGWRLLQGLGE